MTETTQVPEAIEDGKTKITIPTSNYVDAKSASGAKTKNNGDLVATTLAGRPLDQVLAIAAEMTDVPADELEAKYAHLNIGQQRMNLGNRIRGAVNKMTKAAEKEGADPSLLTGEDFLAQVADGYVVPEQPVKAVKEEKTED